MCKDILVSHWGVEKPYHRCPKLDEMLSRHMFSSQHEASVKVMELKFRPSAADCTLLKCATGSCQGILLFVGWPLINGEM